MSSDVLLVQNTRTESSGRLGSLLADDGFKITLVNAKHNNNDAILDGNFALVVLLGAPESANDDLPHLNAEKALIRDSVNKEVPVLGICLGSQLIASAFGASVYKGCNTEIGFYNDLKKSGNTSLFSGFSDPFTVFHWHGDTFDLPDGASRLASSKFYPNQAFQYRSAVGVQFHLEVDIDMVNFWVDNMQKRNLMNSTSAEKIKEDAKKYTQTVCRNMDMFYNNFKFLFNL